MNFKEICDAIPKGWFEKLEKIAEKERRNRYIYDKNYSDKMTYDRFLYIQHLEGESFFGHIGPDRAIELLNKYDEHHPTERFNQF